MKETDHDSIITSVKDSMFGSLLNKAVNGFDIDLSTVSDDLYNGSEKYKFNYYTSGVIYVRDETDRVVTAFVVGEDIFNAAGFHTGLSLAKSEQVYSSPDESVGVNINIGTLVRSFLDIGDIEDTDLVGSVYYSCDSNEQMDLVFCDGVLKMIIVSSR